MGEELQGREPLQVRLPDRALQGQVAVTPFPLHVDQAGFGQLLDMVRDSGRTDDLMLLQRGTGQGAGLTVGDLLQDGKTPRVGNGFADCQKLLVGELCFLYGARFGVVANHSSYAG